jgi:hypothetical protein
MTRYVLLGLTFAVALTLPASANLILNGGFELGDTGPINGAGLPTNWYSWGSSGWHHDDAGRVIDTKAIKFWWDDAGVWQDVPVSAGTDYQYGVQVFNASADRLIGWNGLLRAEFYNSALGTDPGHLLGSQEWRYYSSDGAVDQWVPIGGTVTAPAGADLARMVLRIVDWQPTQGGSLNFDAASIVAVPEPAAALLLLVLAGALRRR